MVNRDDLIAYLLHQMPESERLGFAERWFPDPDLSEQLSMAEAELFDAYVCGDLPRKHRVQLERFLLNSPEQRRKLEFSAALHGVLPPRQQVRVSWFTICAAAILVILLGAVLWIGRQNRELRSQIAALQNDARPLPGGVYSASLTGGGLRGD